MWQPLKIKGNCFICHQPLALKGHGICSVCVSLIPTLPAPCAFCALPAENGHICHYCQQKQPGWRYLIAVSSYDDPLKMLVHQLKFFGKSELSTGLARLMMLCWLNARRKYGFLKPDYIIPVPLTRKKFWQRGTNQAELLAKPLAYWLQKSYQPRIIKRQDTGPDQKMLSAQRRKQNLQSAFSCDARVAGKRILLVDDIVTTGATLEAICAQMVPWQPGEIQVICLCRTL